MSLLSTTPAVFAVENEYQILFPVKRECLAWVEVGGNRFYDAQNGILRSADKIHRIIVPMNTLDSARKYTVCLKPVRCRLPYHTNTGALETHPFVFRPVPQRNARAYHIADTHGRIRQAITAARTFGQIDLLILNGDLMDHCGNRKNILDIYRLCEALTGGALPIVFARGNHDMRGRMAERLDLYTPVHNTNTYYSFRLGSLWGIVLDCGEDKEDHHPEYGGAIACRDFRQRQTVFLEKIVLEREYDAPQIQQKIVICHMPFTQKNTSPFDIEEDIYRRWTDLLGQIKPDMMLCGHTHKEEIRLPGHQKDHYGQPCPVIIGAGFDDRTFWTGCGIRFEEKIRLTFTNSNGGICKHE